MRRSAVVLSVLGLVAMAVAAVLGLAVAGVYGPPASVAAMLRGYDLVTLAVAVPLLAGALLGMRRGSVVAELVWVGGLAYGVYTYAVYLFAAGFHGLFLLHVVAFACCVWALPSALTTLDPAAVVRRASGRVLPRIVSVVLAILAVALGGMWVIAALRYAVTGVLPVSSALVEPDVLVHAGIALDLALLVPAYGLAAVLLWRRTGWGYVAAGAALVSGTLLQVGYLVALPFQAAAGVPGAQAFDAGEPPIALAYLLATITLFACLRHPAPAQGDGAGQASTVARASS
ncbi:hypothetical protein ACL02T_23140 [Pseudonocardia sp. RS010]|uniref:hypothetical protein n=1 Tax=Pseudonocardia sp. RS010 TaxID=3385979 RepID=UPI0039A2A060